MDNKSKGEKGELLARKHYKSLKCEILESNYRFGRAEIDLIVLMDETLLIFVEVKNRTRSDFGEAETFVSEAQQQRIREAAEDYIFAINWKKDIRFDIVCVNADDQIEIFEDAF